jgi:hypothetical protein
MGRIPRSRARARLPFDFYAFYIYREAREKETEKERDTLRETCLGAGIDGNVARWRDRLIDLTVRSVCFMAWAQRNGSWRFVYIVLTRAFRRRQFVIGGAQLAVPAGLPGKGFFVFLGAWR